MSTGGTYWGWGKLQGKVGGCWSKNLWNTGVLRQRQNYLQAFSNSLEPLLVD